MRKRLGGRRLGLRYWSRHGFRLWDEHRNDDLFHRLTDLDELRGARARVRLELPPLRPVVRLVVVVHVAEQQALLGAVDDQPHVGVDPNRPEALVARLVEPVELEPRGGRVHLQVERRRLDGLLLVAGQSA